jgi:hypothetical protein
MEHSLTLKIGSFGNKWLDVLEENQHIYSINYLEWAWQSKYTGSGGSTRLSHFPSSIAHSHYRPTWCDCGTVPTQTPYNLPTVQKLNYPVKTSKVPTSNPHENSLTKRAKTPTTNERITQRTNPAWAEPNNDPTNDSRKATRTKNDPTNNSHTNERWSTWKDLRT